MMLDTFGRLTLSLDMLGLESTRGGIDSVPQGARWVKIGAPIATLHSLCVMQSMGDAVHSSRMMIIRIVLYKDCFDVCITNAGDIMNRIVSNRN